MKYSAQNLAAQGRYGDTTLVHMNPQEVGGLQALARSQGTSLTINPNTGLPEAFNLSGFLPALAGAGLAMIPGLNLNPLTIGLLTGGLGAAATGDIKKGLMIGLGAAGGAGLAGSAGLTGASSAGTGAAGGAAGAGGVTAPSAGTAFSGVPTSNLPATISSAEGAAMNFGGPQFATAPTPVNYGLTGGPGTGGAGFSATKGLASTGYGADSYSLGSKFGTPIGQTYGSTAGVTPSATAMAPKVTPSTMDFLSANKSNISMAAAPVISDALKTPEVEPLEPATYRPYDLTIENVSGQYPYAPGSTKERDQIRYAFKPRPVTTDPNQAVFAADGGFMGRGDTDPVEMMSGGLAAFKQGQYLQGGGDGMSDSIPAVIANRQPARLADGEFVVPADVVSGLGNGSSNAGAKQLYGMMDRVRQGRTGKKKQAPEIKSTKYMPA